MNGVEDRTSVFERATGATLGSRATSPTSVKEPGLSVVLGHLVREHLSVTHGMQDQEGLSKAGRESSLGLSNAVFGTSHLGGVTRNEVVHDLLVGELGNRRKDTAGIAGEENDVSRVVI